MTERVWLVDYNMNWPERLSPCQISNCSVVSPWWWCWSCGQWWRHSEDNCDWRYCLSDHWYMMYDSLTQTMRSSSNYIQPGLLYLLISTYFCQFRCYNLTLLHLKLVPEFLPRTSFKNVQIQPGEDEAMSGMLGRCGWWQICWSSVSPSLCSKAQSNCVQSNLTNRIRKLYSICPPHSKC